ncbi:MAG: manganese-binding transcriptional regulator MntR [Fimbriimonadaceae bacterium]|nr:manganese-binding transcriptional regulator MntR [Fimbriimonadaceae bacterium]
MRQKTEREPTNRFVRTRDDHAKEIAADYVELIQDLIGRLGEARAADIAAQLGVSHVTVTKTIQRLQRDGLVTSLPYRSVFLTEAGRELAASMKIKHQLVLDFLLALGVPPDEAETDAEGIEHHVSDATLDAMARFLKARP